MGLCLGAIVEAKDGFNQADEVVGELNRTFAHTVDGTVAGLLLQGHAEGCLQGGGGSGEPDIAGSGRWRSGIDGEPKLFGEAANRLNGDGIRTVLGGELRA